MAPQAEAAQGAALGAALAAYAGTRRPQARDLRIDGLRRIFGGGSRETWLFTLHERVDGHALAHPLVLRRDPGVSLIDTTRRVEVAALGLFADGEVPVPRTWWLEEDPAVLGAPFMVMEAVTGCEAGPMKLMGAPFAAHHARIAEQKWRMLGAIARTDPGPLQALTGPVTVHDAWRRELDHWRAVVERQARQPQPVTAAAIRWLGAHPPPPAQRLSVVHGDYRTGNLLVAPDGELRAVLDWEMAHAGDPLEDLAWSLGRVWCFQRDDRVGGLVPRERAIAIWEAASGLAADPRALHWWELFNAVKGQGIWLGAAQAFDDSGRDDLLLAYAAWALGNSQDRAILQLMGRLR